MGNVLDVDANSLDKASTGFDDESRALGEAKAKAAQALASLGDIYGTDHTGRKFYSQYHPNEGTVMGNLEILAQGLGKISQGLEQMATNHRNADKASRMPVDSHNGG